MSSVKPSHPALAELAEIIVAINDPKIGASLWRWVTDWIGTLYVQNEVHAMTRAQLEGTGELETYLAFHRERLAGRMGRLIAEQKVVRERRFDRAEFEVPGLKIAHLVHRLEAAVLLSEKRSGPSKEPSGRSVEGPYVSRLAED
jgi:hypothetical protein